MSGGRPNSETARRMGVVPFSGAPDASRNNTGSGNYPNINTNKSGDYAGYPAAPENLKTASSGQGGQLWSNGSGAHNYQRDYQGSAPAWPDSQEDVPGKNFDNRQTAAPGGPTGGRYIQQGPPQPANTHGAATPPQYQQRQQQQQPSWQENVQQGYPAHQADAGYVQGTPAGNRSQQQQDNSQGQQGGYLAQGPNKGPIPKGDYVYYDGNGNQMQPGGGGPQGAVTGSGHGTGSGSEKHFHHHYYHNNQQQQQQAPPVGYPYNKKMEEKKKRKPGATALAAALIACWACTCCCHAPCGC